MSDHLATIADWLALTDPMPAHVDVLLLFGGSLPDAWDAAAAEVGAGRVGTLVLVGGAGHTTDVLRSLLGATDGTEADLMAAYLQREHGLTDVLLERESTNCGNNVTLAREVVLGAGLRPSTVALVQDPTMQRRMDAVFRLVWPEARAVNRPGPRTGRFAWPHDAGSSSSWARCRGCATTRTATARTAPASSPTSTYRPRSRPPTPRCSPRTPTGAGPPG